MKSLNYKLVTLYVISVFVVVTVVFLATEFVAYERSETNAIQLMEIGPGYVNDATPAIIEAQARNNQENIYDRIHALITGNTATSVLQNFRPVLASTTPGGLNGEVSITLLPELFRSSDNYYLLGHSASEIGPLIISDNFFPATVSSLLNGPPWRRLYYSPVESYEDLVIIASLDIRFLPEKSWLSKVPGDVILVSPLVLVVALLLGSAITRMTVSPITRLTQFSEKLASGALDKRTSLASKDELGRLAHSLNQMAAKLEEAFDSQKRFVSNAAHELRTPLASMKIAVTGALTNGRAFKDNQQLLDFLSRRIETQERLISDLLLQARADATGLTTEGRQVDIVDIAARAIAEFEPVFEDRGIKFGVNLEKLSSGKHLYVIGVPGHLFHLFSNLLDNAVKNTPSGGNVSIEITSDNHNAVIKVRDTGRGIAPEHLDKIFERFYKATGDRSPESGFGLGLSICRGIARSHGGEISVKSTVGQGSVFTVRLPLYIG